MTLHGEREVFQTLQLQQQHGSGNYLHLLLGEASCGHKGGQGRNPAAATQLILTEQDKEWGFIPKSYGGGKELRDRQYPVKEWDSTAEPQAEAPFAGLSQLGCSSTKQLAGKCTSFTGKLPRLEKSLSLSNPAAIRDKDRDNTLQC